MKAYYQDYGSIPERAGKAKLVFKDVKLPSRKGDVITLPKDNWGIYQLTHDFSQFLFLKDTPDEHDSRYTPPRKAWFGGTDEQPFLVELTTIASLSGSDEKADEGDWLKVWQNRHFFETIKPIVIKRMELRYGVEKTKRQGDMFCYPMPHQNWNELMDILGCIGANRYIKQVSKNSYDYETELFKTRHHLDGEIAKYDDKNPPSALIKGVIKAPDHKDLEINEICVVAQTRNLKDSQNAD